MKFARVIGTVVATRKYEGLEGIKFLVVQRLDEDLNPQGRPVIAADATARIPCAVLRRAPAFGSTRRRPGPSIGAAGPVVSRG